MNQEEKQFEYEDEIDLMDYLKVIVKRKWLILVIFLVAVIAAGIFSYFAPKIYKIDSSLEIGIIGDKVIEEPSQVIGKINGDAYGILVREKLNISEENYPKIKTENPKDTNLVRIEIESVEPKLAQSILEETNNLIFENHQEEIKGKKEPLEIDIGRFKTKVISLEEEKKNLEAQIEILEKVPSEEQIPASQFALFSTKEKLEAKRQKIEDLYFKINSLEGSLEDIQPTKIVKVPTVSERPVKPKILLNVIIAAILGIFIGIFGAFFKEWWDKSKA